MTPLTLPFIKTLIIDNPANHALWRRARDGFKLISGRGWEHRADYQHFWPLVRKLYTMAYGDSALLPAELDASLSFMLGAHAGRTRKGIRERPYFHHILMVLYLAWLCGLSLAYQQAAIHHDDIEDLPEHLGVTEAWVRRHLLLLTSDQTLAVVTNLTNDIHEDGTKHAMQTAKIAQLPVLDATLKLLDRIVNFWDTGLDKPKSFTPKRIRTECQRALELDAAMPVKAPDHIRALLAFSIERAAKQNDIDLHWAV